MDIHTGGAAVLLSIRIISKTIKQIKSKQANIKYSKIKEVK